MAELHVTVAAPAEESSSFIQGEAVIGSCCYFGDILQGGLCRAKGYYLFGVGDAVFVEGREGGSLSNFDTALTVGIVAHCPDLAFLDGDHVIG